MLLKLKSRPLYKDFQTLQCLNTGLEQKIVLFTLYGTEPKPKSHASKPDA